MIASAVSRIGQWAVISFWLTQAGAAVAPQPGRDFAEGVREPYPQLTGGGFTGLAVAESPDPLVGYRWQSVHAADGLQVYTLRPQRVSAETPGAFGNLQSATGRAPRVTVRGTGSIRFDFGIESAAWLEFDSPDLSGGIEMSISEYNRPAIVNSGPPHPAKTAAPVRYGHTYRLELNPELYEGVRFGWIHVRKFSKPWHITAVRLVCQTKPANYQGAFAASDPLLTRIWYSGAYAVKLNLLKDYFGAILMDRGDRISWTGDAHPAQAAALVAFGNWDFIKENLARTAHMDNGIESYSLYWILSLVDYYRYTGDAAAFDQLATVAQQKVAHAEKVWEDPRMGQRSLQHHPHLPGRSRGLVAQPALRGGLQRFYGWDERLGAGFENPDNPESQNAYRLLTIRACKEFAWALGARGRASDAAAMDGVAARLTHALESRPGWDRNAGLHVAVEAVTAGLASATQQLWSREFADPVNRLSYSPFNEYFVLQALARVGMYQDALAIVRELWGGQLQYGGTCFFETYRPSWNLILKPNDPVPNCQAGYTSLCHPWSSGVTKWLSEEVLGIQPVTPGFATYAIVPHLGPTLTAVRGTTPTPHGEISVDLDTARGSMVVTAPAGTRGTIAIPRQNRTIRGISADGRVVWDGAFHQAAGHEDGQFVYFTGVEPGRHAFRIEYGGPAAAPSEKAAVVSYHAALVKVDSVTGANRQGVYGSEGSVEFSLGASGGDRRRLPDYVAEVAHRSARKGAWTLPSGKIGYLMTGNPAATQQTMTVDVRLKADHPYRMALYVIDGDRQQRRMAVELFDLETKKILAPVALVDNFDRGKYLVYEYNRSCRIRLDQVTGGDAVISGLYFDPGPQGR